MRTSLAPSVQIGNIYAEKHWPQVREAEEHWPQVREAEEHWPQARELEEHWRQMCEAEQHRHLWQRLAARRPRRQESKKQKLTQNSARKLDIKTST